MQLSRAQLETLTDARKRAFDAECVALLRTTWRGRFAHEDDDALHAVVAERRAAAARYGFTGQRDIYRFLNLSCYLGIGFEGAPELSWVVTLLRAPGLDLGRRVELVIDRHEADLSRSR